MLFFVTFCFLIRVYTRRFVIKELGVDDCKIMICALRSTANTFLVLIILVYVCYQIVNTLEHHF